LRELYLPRQIKVKRSRDLNGAGAAATAGLALPVLSEQGSAGGGGRRPPHAGGDDGAAARSIATVEALTHAAVVNRPEVLRDKSGVFADEVTRLVVGYLRGP
jgi:hypothetical protein